MKTLAACLVIKNESKVIDYCLSQVRPFVNQIIVVDTGSTDNTIELVQNWAERFGFEDYISIISVGGKFHDADGDFHFGDAKTFAMHQASTDYVLWMDANDVLVDPVAARNEFDRLVNDGNEYYITMPTSLSPRFSYNRKRIVPRENAYVHGRVHEYIAVDPKLLHGHIQSQFNNQRNSPNLERNIKLLTKDWNEEKTPRTAFYIANTYREMKDDTNALKWFTIRAYTPEWKGIFHEEHYKALECVAELSLPLYKDKKISKGDFFDICEDMINLDKTRPEGYFYMGELYLHTQQYKKALDYLSNYSKCKIPQNPCLWLDRRIYKEKIMGRRIQYCEMAIKNSTVLTPDEVYSAGGTESTYAVGNGQY